MTAGDKWFFDLIAPIYDLGMFDIDRDALRVGLDHAHRPIQRILDVGGGTGRAVAALSIPNRIVVDTSIAMLREVPAEIETVAATAEALPIRDSSVDAVLVVDALHHIPTREHAIQDAIRVLRPGGVLVVRDFDPHTFRGRFVEFGEHILGMQSSFRSPEAVGRILEDFGLAVSIPHRGFTYTVVGRVGDAAPPSQSESPG